MKTLLAAATLALVSTPAASAADRPVIATRSDLPPNRFRFAAPPSVAMDRADFAAMFPAIRAEAERLLRDYEIKDATITADLAFGLAAIAVLDGRTADADRLVAQYRALQTKPQGKAIGALSLDLSVRAAAVGGGCDAAAARLRQRLSGAEPVTIRDQFLQSYSGLQTASVPFLAGTAVGLFNPVVKERGSLDVIQALRLAYFRLASTVLPPCRAQLTTVAAPGSTRPPIARSISGRSVSRPPPRSPRRIR